MKLKMLFAALFLAVVVTSARANATAGDLQKTCQTFIEMEGNSTPTVTQANEMGLCVGVVVGYFEASSGMAAIDGTGEDILFIYKPDTSMKQLVYAFVKYMNSHSQEKDKPIATTLLNAFSSAHLLAFKVVKAVPKAVDQ